jgi:ribosome-binding protein aMBF1 (putative translation factor)
MAKYSTGSAGDGSSESCELCGASGVDTRAVEVAGAKLDVCSECAQHDDRTTTSSNNDDDGRENRKKRAAQNVAKMHDAAKGDSAHWESGADYDDDQLPYLVTDYDEKVTSARQDAGFQLEELAEELGIGDDDLLALEQGRATQAGVGGSVVAAVEEFLDIDLVEGE